MTGHAAGVNAHQNAGARPFGAEVNSARRPPDQCGASTASAAAAMGRRPLVPTGALLQVDCGLILRRRRVIAGRARVAERVPGGVEELVGPAAGRAVVVARLELA